MKCFSVPGESGEFVLLRSSTAGSHGNHFGRIEWVVHDAADEMGLEVAASTSDFDVEIIVFLLIMLHQAPAALGIFQFLVHEEIERHNECILLGC